MTTLLTEKQKEHKASMVAFFEQKMKVSKAIKQIVAIVEKANPKDLLKYDVDMSVYCSNIRVFYAENKKYVFGGQGIYITDGKCTYRLKKCTLYTNSNTK
jgi:hypothetical protein